MKLILGKGEKLTPDELLDKALQGDMFGGSTKPTEEKLTPAAKRTKSTQFYLGPRGGKWADPEHTIPWSGEGGGEVGQTTIDAPSAKDVTHSQHENPAVLTIIKKQTAAFAGYYKEAMAARGVRDKKTEAAAWARAEKTAQSIVAALEHLGESGTIKTSDWRWERERAAGRKREAFAAAERSEGSYADLRDRERDAYRRTAERCRVRVYHRISQERAAYWAVSAWRVVCSICSGCLS